MACKSGITNHPPYPAWSAYGNHRTTSFISTTCCRAERSHEQGVYLVGDKLPAERFVADEKREPAPWCEAIIMLEVEGYVEVRKGSGIHVISNQPKHSLLRTKALEFASYGPFELPSARQLIESNIAEFAATQVTKQDIMKLMEIRRTHAGKMFPRFEWDLQFHVQVALATQNTALAAIVEKNVDSARSQPVLEKNCTIISIHVRWITGGTITTKSSRRWIRKDPHAAKLAMRAAPREHS